MHLTIKHEIYNTDRLCITYHELCKTEIDRNLVRALVRNFDNNVQNAKKFFTIKIRD